jgi:hypothetical protein
MKHSIKNRIITLESGRQSKSLIRIIKSRADIMVFHPILDRQEFPERDHNTNVAASLTIGQGALQLYSVA